MRVEGSVLALELGFRGGNAGPGCTTVYLGAKDSGCQGHGVHEARLQLDRDRRDPGLDCECTAQPITVSRTVVRMPPCTAPSVL